MAAVVARWSLFLLLIAPLHSHIVAVATQACYYPDGEISTEDVPCGSSPSICCPLGWSCETDGLCYLANEDYYERHTCTDKTWPSDSCPRICTHDMTATGNEALLWCSSGEWCCDGNRSWNCCTTADTEFFNLPAPRAYAFISASPSVNPSAVPSSQAPSSTEDKTSTSTSVPSSAPTSTTTPSSSSAPGTAEPSSHTTASNSRLANTLSSSTSSSSEPTTTDAGAQLPNKSSHSDLPIIVGLAVGIPLICIVGGLIVFLVYRHYRPRRNKESRPPSPPIPANYQPIPFGAHAPELAGYPIAPKRTKSGRESELYGSEVYLSPTPSSGTIAQSPPGYSPGQGGGGMVQIQEEPAELWGGYVPYRPSGNQVRGDGGGGMEGGAIDEDDAVMKRDDGSDLR